MPVFNKSKTATIANAASLSGAVNPGPCAAFAIQMPASWTTANLTFQASFDGTTFADMYDEAGTEVTISGAASRFIILEPARWLGVRYFKIRSGTSAAPVSQGAARTIRVVVLS